MLPQMNFPVCAYESWNIDLRKHIGEFECSNYRLISLLYGIDKILTKDLFATEFIVSLKKRSHISADLVFNTITHGLIYLTDTIGHNKSNYACGIFVDFQKALDTLDHLAPRKN